MHLEKRKKEKKKGKMAVFFTQPDVIIIPVKINSNSLILSNT